MRDAVFYQYRFGVRLAHFLTIVLLGPLYLTGLRLGSIMGETPTLEPGSVIDNIVPAGRLLVWHAALGYFFVAVGIFYLAHLLLSDQLRRLTNVFTHRRYRLGKKISYMIMIFLGAVVAVSGLTLQLGLFKAHGGFALMQWLHRYGVAALLLMGLAHCLGTILNKESRVNSIFLDPSFPGFWQKRPLIFSALLAVVVLFGLFLGPPLAYKLEARQIPGPVEIDGVPDEPQWAEADSIMVGLIGGANFYGSATVLTVKAFANGSQLYLLFTYPDPGNSQNRHLVKTDSGWIVERSAYPSMFGESIYWEDQAAISFTRESGGCAAGCHIGRGVYGHHEAVGSMLDLWLWQAVGTDPVGQADDRYLPAAGDSSWIGFLVDNPAAGSTHSNFNKDWRQPYLIDLVGTQRSWLPVKSDRAVPYFAEKDSFPPGTVQPGVLVTSLRGDRGDIRAQGRWYRGRWTIEWRRRLKTGSQQDLDLAEVSWLNVALFDNARLKHAFHSQAIQLTVEEP